MAQKVRVFVVDDEPIIASTLAIILQSRGFDATSFTMPQAALEASRTDPPNLLISDVIMPVMSGVELAHRVLRLCPECKVLMFSGQAAMGEFADLAEANAGFEILIKPVHPDELLSKIEEMIAPSVVLKSVKQQGAPGAGFACDGNFSGGTSV